MSDDVKSIHEFDLALICEYFAGVERQGPGSPEVTQKALSFVEGLTAESRIVDLGCGTGGQTMVLAQDAPGISSRGSMCSTPSSTCSTRTR